MKCRSCQIDVPPTFTKALIDNRCPACGKEIMGGADFREMLQLQKLLNGLQLDEKSVIMIAAALSSKFDLVPKSSRAKEQAASPAEDVVSVESVEVSEAQEEDDSASAEEKIRRKAFLQAQKERQEAEDKALVDEWGLDRGEFSGAAGRTGPPPKANPAFVGMFEDSPGDFEALPPPPFVSNNNKMIADREIRLAKAEAARNSGSFMVSRRDA